MATPETLTADAHTPAGDEAETKRKGPRTWIDRLRSSGVPIAPLAIFAIMVVVALGGPLLPAVDAYAFSLGDRLSAPSLAAPMGTDDLGRDVLSRVVVGSQVTLLVVVVSIAAGGAIGLALGVISGYFGGAVDAVISRLTDATLAFPTLLFGLLFAVSLGPSFSSVVIAISLSLWAEFVRVVRSEVLSVKSRPFIAAAHIYGSSHRRTILLHVLPNVFNSFVVLMGVNLGKVILSEASLSYLGAGIPKPTPSWGNMISDGQSYIADAWWIALFPGIALSLTVFALFLLGDWLRDRLDPRVTSGS